MFAKEATVAALGVLLFSQVALAGPDNPSGRKAAVSGGASYGQGEQSAAPSDSSRGEGSRGKAEPSDTQQTPGAARQSDEVDAFTHFRRRDCELFCYVHWYSGVGVGKGVRFNNPFRLRTQLGSTSESLSFTSSYADLSVAAVLGDPHGFQQGLSVNASIALEGVPQEVLAPSYAALYRLTPYASLRGRVGLPVIIEPDLNVGAELALGAGYLFWSGFGLYADIVLSGFQGAATDESSSTLIPLLSLQAGIAVDYEVLP